MRGGKRSGAGRPKGAISKVTAEAIEAASEGGELPLDYMLRVMRDRTIEHSRRDDMAKAAANYVHHRLSTTDATIKAQVAVTKIEEVIVDPVASVLYKDDIKH